MTDSSGDGGAVRFTDPDLFTRAREALGLSVATIADRCGVTRQMIGRLVTDPDRSGISPVTAACVSEVVGVRYDVLWRPARTRAAGNDCPSRT